MGMAQLGLQPHWQVAWGSGGSWAALPCWAQAREQTRQSGKGGSGMVQGTEGALLPEGQSWRSSSGRPSTRTLSGCNYY